MLNLFFYHLQKEGIFSDFKNLTNKYSIMFDFKVTNILEGKPADIIAKDAMLDIQDVQYYKGFRNIAIHLSGNRP